MSTAEVQAERKVPGEYFPAGRKLADNFDGEVCASIQTFDGSVCELPARYGRSDIQDPSDTRCVRHAGDEPKCRAPTLHGGRCQLPAAFGVEDADEGPCVHHTEAVRADRRILQAEFLVELSKCLTISGAAERVGVARYTAQLWKAHNEEFARAVERLLNGQVSRARLERAEEVLWERVTGDEAGQAERIFYLVNASSDADGWRDVKLVKHDHRHSGGVLHVPASPDGSDWEEAAREQQRALQEETGTGGREIEATVREARDVDD